MTESFQVILLAKDKNTWSNTTQYSKNVFFKKNENNNFASNYAYVETKHQIAHQYLSVRSLNKNELKFLPRKFDVNGSKLSPAVLYCLPGLLYCSMYKNKLTSQKPSIVSPIRVYCLMNECLASAWRGMCHWRVRYLFFVSSDWPVCENVSFFFYISLIAKQFTQFFLYFIFWQNNVSLGLNTTSKYLFRKILRWPIERLLDP